MSLGAQTVFNELSSHAQTLGVFEAVNTHEPKDAPSGPHCSFNIVGVRPDPEGSGLDRTTARVVVLARIYIPMLQEPQDAIDPQIVVATDKLMEAYSTDNTLGGNVMTIDLLGMGQERLEGRAGYITLGGTSYRSMDIQIPCIVADAWTQGS